MKKTILLAMLAFSFILHAHAQKSEVYVVDGRAIKGYDPVAFITESKAVKGQDSLLYRWKDANWLFSSRKNLALFKANPDTYAPQYGGYCAYGTAMGHKAPTETDTWTVVDGKLYFNYNGKVKEMWVKDQPGFIQKADQQWPVIKDKK